MIKLRLIILAVIAFSWAFLGCSEKSKPSGPVAYNRGRISVENLSGVAVRIIDMTQKRGDRQARINIGMLLHPGSSYPLRNILDEGAGFIFSGGDRVDVRFRAEETDPYNPNEPLFQDDVSMTVNGNLILRIKSGGISEISPGG